MRSLSMHEHKLAIGMIILVMLAILDASALTLVICINWATPVSYTHLTLPTNREV